MTVRPDLYWRDVVRRGFSRFRATSPDPEGDFLRYVDALYREEKERCGALPADAPESARGNVALYTLAVALLTYGRLEVVEDLLRNIPPGRHPARVLARSVDALIPLRAGLDPLVDAEATLGFIDEHRARLAWCVDEGRFRLEDARPSP
jgi:hypothetical protein